MTRGRMRRALTSKEFSLLELVIILTVSSQVEFLQEYYHWAAWVATLIGAGAVAAALALARIRSLMRQRRRA